MEKNIDVGFAMVHRKIINENGKIIKEKPFYNKSCIIPGAEAAAVYMMAAINPSVSQIMYRRSSTLKIGDITDQMIRSIILIRIDVI